MKTLRNNRGVGIIEAIIIVGIFAFACWFADTNYNTPKNDPQGVVNEK